MRDDYLKPKIYNLKLSEPFLLARLQGWQFEIINGTIFSAEFFDRFNGTRRKMGEEFITILGVQGIIFDANGNTPPFLIAFASFRDINAGFDRDHHSFFETRGYATVMNIHADMV